MINERLNGFNNASWHLVHLVKYEQRSATNADISFYPLSQLVLHKISLQRGKRENN